jgi:hypothetical protein
MTWYHVTNNQHGKKEDWPMSETGLLTVKEIKRLPARAAVAFAARCARRVQVLFLRGWPSAPEEWRRALEDAVLVAERLAAQDPDADLTADLCARAEANATFGALCAQDAAVEAASPYCCANAARAAAFAARAAFAAARHDDAEAAEAAATAAELAARAALDAKFVRAIKSAMRRDLSVLSAAALRDRWTHDTPVPPDFFGPLWPDGRPPYGWPEPERSGAPQVLSERPVAVPKSDNAELVLTIDVPEGIPDEDVLGLVAELVTRADALHRAYGGHGLEVEEGNVEINRETPQPAPAGGQS